MKTKKYAIGTYDCNGEPKTKTKKIIKRVKHNKTYNGKPTKRRKENNLKWAFRTLIVLCLFTTSYAFAMTSNSYNINGAAVKGTRPTSELDACVRQDNSEAEKLKAPASLPVMVETKPTVEDVKKEIIKQSREFGLNENMMLALADCESEFIWNAKNPTSTARGVYQYLIGTWEETESAKQGFERNDIEANIREAMIDISNGESWRWPDCKAKLKTKGIYL